jgi:hypothetical protein
MNAGATAPEWAAGSALPFLDLDMRDGYSYPGTSSLAMALHSTRNGHHVEEFPASEEDATQDDSALWQGVMPDGYAGGNLLVELTWAAEGATSGATVWLVSFERIGTALDIDADSFATALTVTTTTSGTDGIPVVSAITFTQAEADSIAGGECYRVHVVRNSNEALDTLAVRAQLLGLSIEEQ